MSRTLLQLLQVLTLARVIVTYTPVYETESEIEPENNAKEPLSLAKYQSYSLKEQDGPGTYAFGYDIDDVTTGNTQFRDEQRYVNGTVVGSYGYLDPDGNAHIVRYVADHLGYRAKVETKRSHWGTRMGSSKRIVKKSSTTFANNQRVAAKEQHSKPIDRKYKQNLYKKTNRQSKNFF